MNFVMLMILNDLTKNRKALVKGYKSRVIDYDIDYEYKCILFFTKFNIFET